MTRHKGRHHADWHPLKERASAQWAQHDCDMGKAHGTRHKLRGQPRRLSYGLGLTLKRQQTALGFLLGKGLVRSPQRYALYVQGKQRGWLADINAALAWARAAKLHGLDARCEEV